LPVDIIRPQKRRKRNIGFGARTLYAILGRKKGGKIHDFPISSAGYRASNARRELEKNGNTVRTLIDNYRARMKSETQSLLESEIKAHRQQEKTKFWHFQENGQWDAQEATSIGEAQNGREKSRFKLFLLGQTKNRNDTFTVSQRRQAHPHTARCCGTQQGGNCLKVVKKAEKCFIKSQRFRKE
jgi:hypothetical protein